MAGKKKTRLTLEQLIETRELDWVRARRPGDAPAFLVHIYPSGPSLGWRYPLGADPVILGRSPECDIPVEDCSVSRRHARIEARAGSYFVTDLESTNGTFVNDQSVTDGRLTDGDYLRIAGTIYRFLAGDNVEAAYHEEIYRLTIIDALTGTYNKRYLLEYLDRELERSARHGRPLALIMFDLDRFKAINENMGHLGGDFTLRELAACIRSSVRRDELFARYGGEEFVLVLPEADLDGALKAAERFRCLVEDHTFHYQSKAYRVTISLGVAVSPGINPYTFDELIQRADEKLYEAKRAGRNCVRG